MNKLAFYVFFVFLQPSLFTFGHYSRLEKLEDAMRNDLGNFGDLIGDSNSQDQAGICYGTYGAATLQTGPFQVLPRCHSEFFLLKQIQQYISVLAGYTLYIRNQSYPPCKLTRGTKNPNNGRVELNPGTPCHQYLTNFAKQHACRIIVRCPGIVIIYP